MLYFDFEKAATFLLLHTVFGATKYWRWSDEAMKRWEFTKKAVKYFFFHIELVFSKRKTDTMRAATLTKEF